MKVFLCDVWDKINPVTHADYEIIAEDVFLAKMEATRQFRIDHPTVTNINIEAIEIA